MARSLAAHNTQAVSTARMPASDVEQANMNQPVSEPHAAPTRYVVMKSSVAHNVEQVLLSKRPVDTAISWGVATIKTRRFPADIRENSEL